MWRDGATRGNSLPIAPLTKEQLLAALKHLLKVIVFIHHMRDYVLFEDGDDMCPAVLFWRAVFLTIRFTCSGLLLVFYSTWVYSIVWRPWSAIIEVECPWFKALRWEHKPFFPPRFARDSNGFLACFFSSQGRELSETLPEGDFVYEGPTSWSS